jgi:hypothetical protein
MKKKNAPISLKEAEEIAEAFLAEISNGYSLTLDGDRTIVKPYGFIFELKIGESGPTLYGLDKPIFVDKFGVIGFLGNRARDARGAAIPRRFSEFLYRIGFEELAYRVGF